MLHARGGRAPRGLVPRVTAPRPRVAAPRTRDPGQAVSAEAGAGPGRGARGQKLETFKACRGLERGNLVQLSYL